LYILSNLAIQNPKKNLIFHISEKIIHTEWQKNCEKKRKEKKKETMIEGNFEPRSFEENWTWLCSWRVAWGNREWCRAAVRMTDERHCRCCNPHGQTGRGRRRRRRKRRPGIRNCWCLSEV
jgi:hypothetical protein